ncbi:MAG: hypothetical protein K9N06_02795 [Candidatus Cloacimonetes bacterium]|nr:hypothetical protein [Candidatus Cloacimonadota bacterium]
MKKLPKVLLQATIALIILGAGVKMLLHFLGKLEENDEGHSEPYQPEDE